MPVKKSKKSKATAKKTVAAKKIKPIVKSRKKLSKPPKKKQSLGLSRIKFSKMQALLVVAVFAALGGYFIVRSHAASSSIPSNQPIVGVSSTLKTNDGYWLAAADGGVFTFGSNAYYKSAGSDNLPSSQNVASMVSTPSGGGYWLAQINGGVMAFGDAHYYDNAIKYVSPSTPIVGMASTADGGGYWLVSSTGAIYSFGDAKFYGPSKALDLSGARIVSMATSSSGLGYWLVSSTGGVYTFGGAKFYGPTTALNLSGSTIVNIVSTPDGLGYWLLGSNGGVYTYGDAKYKGSLPGSGVHVSDVVGMASTSDGLGYWIVEKNGTVYVYGDAVKEGQVQYTPCQYNSAISASSSQCVAPPSKSSPTTTKSGSTNSSGASSKSAGASSSSVSSTNPTVPVAPKPGYKDTGCNMAIYSEGSCVVSLQTYLDKTLHFNLTEDGYFGPNTQSALELFQRSTAQPALEVFWPSECKDLSTITTGHATQYTISCLEYAYQQQEISDQKISSAPTKAADPSLNSKVVSDCKTHEVAVYNRVNGTTYTTHKIELNNPAACQNAKAAQTTQVQKQGTSNGIVLLDDIPFEKLPSGGL